MAWGKVQPITNERVRVFNEWPQEAMLEIQTLNISGAQFNLKLRPDLLWQVTLAYPTNNGPEYITMGIEDSYSLARKWVAQVLKTGEDTDMLDRKIDVRSFVNPEDRPLNRYTKMTERVYDHLMSGMSYMSDDVTPAESKLLAVFEKSEDDDDDK